MRMSVDSAVLSPGAFWRIVTTLMSARIDRDIDLYNLLVTARETGQAVLDYAKYNRWLSDSFERAYGIPIKNYFDECMGRKKLEANYGPDYMEYQCWYSLLLRVFLIIHEPTSASDITQSAVTQASEKLRGMERRYGEVGETGE